MGSLPHISTGPRIRLGPCSFLLKSLLWSGFFAPDWMKAFVVLCGELICWERNGRLRDMTIFEKGTVRLVTSVFKNIYKKMFLKVNSHSGPMCREVNEMNLHRKDLIRYRMLKLERTINIIWSNSREIQSLGQGHSM